jgi:hypothetical protein
VAQPLPRSFAARQRLEDERKVARIVAEAEKAAALDAKRPSGVSHASAARLRGLPAIGRNVAGAIPRTSPEQALMAKQGRRRR